MIKINLRDLSDHLPEFIGSSFYTKYISPKIVNDNGYIIDFSGCKYLGWGLMRDLYIINKYRGGLVITGLGPEGIKILFLFWKSMRDGSYLNRMDGPEINFEDRSNLTECIFD